MEPEVREQIQLSKLDERVQSIEAKLPDLESLPLAISEELRNVLRRQDLQDIIASAKEAEDHCRTSAAEISTLKQHVITRLELERNDRLTSILKIQKEVQAYRADIRACHSSPVGCTRGFNDAAQDVHLLDRDLKQGDARWPSMSSQPPPCVDDPAHAGRYRGMLVPAGGLPQLLERETESRIKAIKHLQSQCNELRSSTKAMDEKHSSWMQKVNEISDDGCNHRAAGDAVATEVASIRAHLKDLQAAEVESKQRMSLLEKAQEELTALRLNDSVDLRASVQATNDRIASLETVHSADRNDSRELRTAAEESKRRVCAVEALYASVNENRERIISVEALTSKLSDEVGGLRLNWSSAQSLLAQDVLELLTRFNEAGVPSFSKLKEQQPLACAEKQEKQDCKARWCRTSQSNGSDVGNPALCAKSHNDTDAPAVPVQRQCSEATTILSPQSVMDSARIIPVPEKSLGKCPISSTCSTAAALMPFQAKPLLRVGPGRDLSPDIRAGGQRQASMQQCSTPSAPLQAPVSCGSQTLILPVTTTVRTTQRSVSPQVFRVESPKNFRFPGRQTSMPQEGNVLSQSTSNRSATMSLQSLTFPTSGI